MLRIVTLVSGGGTNLGALIDHEARGLIIGGRLSAVISSKPGVYALERAKEAGIPAYVMDSAVHDDRESYSNALLSKLQELEADLIVLAGFMSVLSGRLLSAYENRIINVHPSLIPSFCGDGFYGLRVHRSVLDYGVKLTGATVHFVNEQTDGGPIILQKAVEVLDGDSPESLQKRVMQEAEWIILPEAVSLFCQNRLVVKGRRVEILKEKQE